MMLQLIRKYYQQLNKNILQKFYRFISFNNILALLLVIFIFQSCNLEKVEKKNNSEMIARVGDKSLYKSDIIGMLPKNHTKNDSIILTRNYIEKWISTKLMVSWAEKNLNENQKNVDKQIEDYKNSLLIYKYEQEYIKQKLDTAIADSLINSYYTKNIQNFLLNYNIIKGLFIKIPLSSPNIDTLKDAFLTKNTETIKRLETYCYQYASKYDFFENQWIHFNTVINKIPDKPQNLEYFLKTHDVYINTDSTFLYLLNINDYKLIGANSPIEFVKESIKTILINKRKTKLITDLEKEIYNNALNNEYFKIYK